MSGEKPDKLIKALRSALLDLEAEIGDDDKISEITKTKVEEAINLVSQTLRTIENVLYGSSHQDEINAFQQEIYSNDILSKLVPVLPQLPPQDWNVVARIFHILLRSRIAVDHIESRPEILLSLLKGYERKDIALTCGKILRQCIQDKSLCSQVLNSDEFYSLFPIIETSNVDVSADVFHTLEKLLKGHTDLASSFVDINYDDIFKRYNSLLRSEDYIVRQRAIRLLADLLQDEAFTGLRRRYLGNHDNLKFVMNTMKHGSEDVQFEIFHIFKVFVADPNKTITVENSLARNKDKIVRFMSKFLLDRESRSQVFKEEKATLVQQVSEISQLEDWDDWSVYSAAI